jgi:hypothetical protein
MTKEVSILQIAAIAPELRRAIPTSAELFAIATAILEDNQVAAGTPGASETHMGHGRIIYVTHDTWNRHVAARRLAEARWREERKAEGRAYWAKRGITVGQKVYQFAASMLGFGGMRVEGIAKVGKVGAYVQSRYQRGYLDPAGWNKPTPESPKPQTI